MAVLPKKYFLPNALFSVAFVESDFIVLPLPLLFGLLPEVLPMRLCMIGARGHSGYVTSVLPTLPEVRLVGICAGDGSEPDLLRKQTSVFAPREYLDWREMLAK